MIDISTLTKHPELAGSLTLSVKGDDLLSFARELVDQSRSGQQNEEIYLTPDEAADFLKISRVTLWAWDKKSILKPIRQGKVTRYKKSDILSALERRVEL